MRKNLTSILAAGAIASGMSGCASVHPNTPSGHLNQYAAAADKVVEMQQKPKVVENNPFNYTMNDIKNAYIDGCFNTSMSSSDIQMTNTYRNNPEEFASRLVGHLKDMPETRIDNAMTCYAAGGVIREAYEWKDRAKITEPLSAVLWLTAINAVYNVNNNGGGGSSSSSIGRGSQDVGKGSAINP